MTKLEEVAAALYEAGANHSKGDWRRLEKSDSYTKWILDDYRSRAKIAIEALLPPTSGMLDAGCDAINAGCAFTHSESGRVFRAMIDQILEEGKK